MRSFDRSRDRRGSRVILMPAHHDTLTKSLAHSSELNITVTGRKSGRAITIPIWFVLDGNTFYLLPVHGSDTQWYKNLLKNPSIRIEAGGAEGAFQAILITDAKQVSSVVDKFRAKYAGDVKKYYSKFDVAVVVDME